MIIYVSLKFAKGVDLKDSHHTHTQNGNYGKWCISLFVVIISQCTHISKHHAVYLIYNFYFSERKKENF